MPTFVDAPPVLRDFLNYLSVIKGKSDGTVKEYYYDLRTFFRFMKVHRRLVPQNFDELDQVSMIDVDSVFLQTVTLSDLYEFLSFVSRYKKNAANARARKVASLRSFFHYATSKAGILKENPAADLETPKLKKTQPRYLTLNESKKLIKTVEHAMNERDICIITLFLNCGIRLSELVGINLSDIHGDSIRILGKGNKERFIYMNAPCMTALQNYLRVRPVDGVADRDALFLSKQKKRISTKMVGVIVKKYIALSGLDSSKYSPHKLRHTAATLMHRYGHVDVRILQEILGHQNLSTTQIYTHLENDQIRDAMKQNPLRGES